jgi:hypothetical protein
VTGAAEPLTPCGCPEAELLRDILAGQVPAADTHTWRALAAAIDAAATMHTLTALRDASHRISAGADWAAVAGAPSHAELQRRRYPPDGDMERWVAHGDQPCPVTPCAGRDCPRPHDSRPRARDAA